MAPRKVVSFLAGSVRLLQKKVEELEQSWPKPPPMIISLDALVSVDVVPSKPPGIFFPLPAPEDYESKCEHGDDETHAVDADASDFFPHQFVEQYEHVDDETHANDVPPPDDGEEHRSEYDDIKTLAIDVPPPDDGEEHLPCDATNKNPDSWMFDVSHTLQHMREKIANLTKDIINLKNESNTKLDTDVDDFSRTQILMIIDIAKKLFVSSSEKLMETMAITIIDNVKKYVAETVDERMADLKKYVKDSDGDLYERIMVLRGDLLDIILNG